MIAPFEPHINDRLCLLNARKLFRIQNFMAQAIAAIIREIENSDEYKKMSYSELEEFLSHIWRVLESYIRVQFGVDPLTDVLNEKAKSEDTSAMPMVQSPETVT